jgi:hypothetical protein
MVLGTIKVGDVVHVDHKGRRFMALVTDTPTTDKTLKGKVAIKPFDARISYRSATSREVIGHWRATKATHARGALAAA